MLGVVITLGGGDGESCCSVLAREAIVFKRARPPLVGDAFHGFRKEHAGGKSVGDTQGLVFLRRAMSGKR